MPNSTTIRLQPATMQEWRPGPDPARDITVLMSGGVDSSVTALLLKRAGWNVLGITMKLPVAANCDYQRSCCGMEAAYVARSLGIPHYYINVREAFEQTVIEPFKRAYAEGRTPSPCVDCNTIFKFRLVWDFIESQFGVAHLATGHYAQVVESDAQVRLARAIDKTRDQSYFLYGIPRQRLPYFHLPLGGLPKTEVREIAREAGLPVARRPDSMELCFVGEGDYRNAISGGAAGMILDSDGNTIGEHSGIANFTIGQRRGLKIAAGKPLYVTQIDPRSNTVTVGPKEDIMRRDVAAGEANVLIPAALAIGSKLCGKIRSQGEPSACTVTEVRDDQFSVTFDSPQLAPSPGQRLVLYDDDACVVAGGTIL